MFEDINSYSLTTEHETPNKVGHTDMIKVYSWRKPSGGYEFYIYEKGHNLREISREELKQKIQKDSYVATKKRECSIEGLDSEETQEDLEIE